MKKLEVMVEIKSYMCFISVSEQSAGLTESTMI